MRRKELGAMATEKKVHALNLDADAVEKYQKIIGKNKLSSKVNSFILDEIDINQDRLKEPENIRILKKEIGNLNRKKTDMERQQADIDLKLPLIISKINFLVSEIKRLEEADNDGK